MRERRLGSLLRHQRWDYTPLFSVTLFLAWWAVMFRVVWTYFIITQVGTLDVGWSSGGPGAPPILGMLPLLLAATVVLTAAQLSDPRNRTPAGYALATCNAAFVLLLGIGASLHAVFARELAAHRASGARSEWNLAAEVSGRWEVVSRDEPDGAPRFPFEALTIRFDGTSAVIGGIGPASDAREVWGRIEATEQFHVKTRLFEQLEAAIFGARDRHLVAIPAPATKISPYEPPALLIEALVRPRIEDLPQHGWCLWAAELDDPNPRMLRFRLVFAERRPLPTTRIDLARADRPPTGLDLAEELADAHAVHWW